jgi:hypothetical protein
MRGQKIGMEAQMMAKSISSEARIIVRGYHHVKSSEAVSLPLWRTAVQSRRMDIRRTLQTVSRVEHLIGGVAYIEPSEKSVISARTCLGPVAGLKYSVIGRKNIIVSNIMLVAAKATNAARYPSMVAKPMPQHTAAGV